MATTCATTAMQNGSPGGPPGGQGPAAVRRGHEHGVDEVPLPLGRGGAGLAVQVVLERRHGVDEGDQVLRLRRVVPGELVGLRGQTRHQRVVLRRVRSAGSRPRGRGRSGGRRGVGAGGRRRDGRLRGAGTCCGRSLRRGGGGHADATAAAVVHDRVRRQPEDVLCRERAAVEGRGSGGRDVARCALQGRAEVGVRAHLDAVGVRRAADEVPRGDVAALVAAAPLAGEAEGRSAAPARVAHLGAALHHAAGVRAQTDGERRRAAGGLDDGAARGARTGDGLSVLVDVVRSGRGSLEHRLRRREVVARRRGGLPHGNPWTAACLDRWCAAGHACAPDHAAHGGRRVLYEVGPRPAPRGDRDSDHHRHDEQDGHVLHRRRPSVTLDARGVHI